MLILETEHCDHITMVFLIFGSAGNTICSVQYSEIIGILHFLGKSAQRCLVSLSALGFFIFSLFVSLPEWDAQFSHSIAQGIRVHTKDFTCATWTVNFAPGSFEYTLDMVFDQWIKLQHFVCADIGRRPDRLDSGDAQVVESKRATPMEYHGAFDDIFEFPYIARPVVGLSLIHI